MVNIETELIEQSLPEHVQIQNMTKHFLVQTCSFCNNKFELSEGDVIFGDKWFHNICWESFNSTKENS